MLTLAKIIEYHPPLRNHITHAYEVDGVTTDTITADSFVGDFVGRWGEVHLSTGDNRHIVFEVTAQSGTTLTVSRDLTGADIVNLIPSYNLEIESAKVEVSTLDTEDQEVAGILYALYLIYYQSVEEEYQSKAKTYLEAFGSYKNKQNNTDGGTYATITTHDSQGRF